MIEKANENIGRKVKIVTTTAHYLKLGSIATIRSMDGKWIEVEGAGAFGQPVVQYLTADDYEFVEDDNDAEE